MAQLIDHRSTVRVEGNPMLAEAVRVPCCELTLRIDQDAWEQVRAEVRQRHADGASTPMTAAHLDALGLRGAITDLMLEG